MKKLLKLLFIVSLFLILPVASFAAVTLNGSANTITHCSTPSASPCSVSMDVASGGTNTAAFACIAYDDAATFTIASVTLGGVAMTNAGTRSSNTGAGTYSQIFYLVNPPTGTGGSAPTLTATGAGGTYRDIYLGLNSFNGVDQSTPVRTSSYQNNVNVNADGSGNFSVTIPSNASDMTISCANGEGTGLNSSNQTYTIDNGGNFSGGQDYASGAANVTHTWNSGAASPTTLAGLSVQAGAAATISQQAYRFYNDDGSESAATGAAAESTAITFPNSTNLRLRGQASTTNDVASNAYQLEYKKSTNSFYRKVPLTQPTITTVGTSSQVVTATTGQTLAPSIPSGVVAGDVLIMPLVERCDVGTITNTVNNNWLHRNTPVTREVTTGATDMVLDVWYKVASTSEPTPTVTPDSDCLTAGTTGGATAQIIAFRGVDPDTIFDNVDATSTAAAAATLTAPQVTSLTNGAVAVSMVGTADDNALNFNTANSFVLNMGEANYDTTTGSDLAVGVGSFVKSTAGAVTMPVWNESLVGNDAWVAASIILKPRVDDILVSVSSNITAGGENSTARLSVPGGKSFTTGRVWDDENGTDSIDIATDRYSEFEWDLQAQSTATNGNIYTFQITKAGVALDAYNVTPQWTIGAVVTTGAVQSRVQINGRVLFNSGASSF